MEQDLRKRVKSVSSLRKFCILFVLFGFISILLLLIQDYVPNKDIVVGFSFSGGMSVLFLFAIAWSELKNLRNELIIRNAFTKQRNVDEKLTRLAEELRVAHLKDIDLQKRVAQEASPSIDLVQEHRSANTKFKTLQKDFFELCKALEEVGYEVLKTAEGKYSIKLYWSKEEKTPPLPTEESKTKQYEPKFSKDEDLLTWRPGAE